MKEGAKLLGHHIHPVLIVFPLGLLGAGTIFDIVYLIRGGASLATAAYWMIASGIIGGVVAAIFGLLDWWAVPGETRAKRIGVIHGLVNAGVLVIFAASWYMRMNNAQNPPTSAAVLSIVGAALSLVGGWLGGELVERLGVGVDAGANPDAPSSLVESFPAQPSAVAKKNF